MKPINFTEANLTLTKPDGLKELDCGTLPVFHNPQDHTYISCWELTPLDLDRIKKTGVLWLGVAGAAHPPVYITTEFPFVYNSEIGRADE